MIFLVAGVWLVKEVVFFENLLGLVDLLTPKSSTWIMVSLSSSFFENSCPTFDFLFMMLQLLREVILLVLGSLVWLSWLTLLVTELLAAVLVIPSGIHLLGGVGGIGLIVNWLTVSLTWLLLAVLGIYLNLKKRYGQ